MMDWLMRTPGLPVDRRFFLQSALAGGAWATARIAHARRRPACAADEPQPHGGKALAAITLDLEMSRHYPRREDMHWDYEKGNLNEPTKQYAVEAGRRVKAAGGVIHYFAVGQLFEQADLTWLKDLAAAGHPVGNHTYDHVYVLAKNADEIQFRFRRSPWLIEGRSVERVIVDNIRLASAAQQTRLGAPVSGFRTPGGFANGLADRPDVRRWLLDLGFRWVSSRYPAHPMPPAGRPPDAGFIAQLLEVHRATQPTTYADGLIEIPMSPVSDIVAFRTNHWELRWFIDVIRKLLEDTIERRTTFDFLCHPSCLYVVDPKFEIIDMIIETVAASRGRAAIVGLDAFAGRADGGPGRG